MTGADSGKLLSRDIEVLRYYARSENRELCWNYLAEFPEMTGTGGWHLVL